MSSASNTEGRPPLRLWPAVVIVALQWFGRFVLPLFMPDSANLYGILGSLAWALVLLLWWLLWSRAPWSDRLGAIAVAAAALFATRALLDPSIATGAMGMLFPILVAPTLSLGLVVGAAAGRGRGPAARRVALFGAIAVSCLGWALVRTGGFTANFVHDFAWRWTPTAEERLVAAEREAPRPARPAATPGTAAPVPAATPGAPAAAAGLAPEPVAPEPATAVVRAAEWPGFRGERRDGHVRESRIATDWTATPPVELWRRPVGPGWSSFAVDGDTIYTQEQRGDEEVVAAYAASSGLPLWQHRDVARFWESNGGAGPRGTPSLAHGRVYTLGATGLLNALDAATGAVAWRRDAAADTGAKLPTWGFSGSPLVLGDQVLVAVSGALAGYDAHTGELRWKTAAARAAYTSPHLVTLAGVEQVLMLDGDGLGAVDAGDGKRLWFHEWKGYPIVQPALTADGGVLFSNSDSGGTRRLAVEREGESWKVAERWTSRSLKSYFSDFVVHGDHAYGFDGGILACIDVATGDRKWKGGRYGQGQLVLLADQDALLVIAEEGELALVSATPDGFQELARRPALEGKTWNHPVVVGDRLYVRNAEEMVAFRLPMSR